MGLGPRTKVIFGLASRQNILEGNVDTLVAQGNYLGSSVEVKEITFSRSVGRVF